MVDDTAHPERRIEWTGERCVPWVDDWQVLYEHLHRYHFAADLADGRRVLDLGSGEGYGSAILAERAKHVLGVELDPEAAAHAAANYPVDNLEFRQASVLELDDLPDASFDLVVCFEMIEHITEHDELLALARRVLAPDGVFVVSTPDREIYSEAAGYHNPYHVRELSRPEFDELLDRYFAHHRLWGQTVTVGSTLERLEHDPASTSVDEVFLRREGDRWVRRRSEPVPYLVAVASQWPLLALPDLSLLNDRDAGGLQPAGAASASPATVAPAPDPAPVSPAGSLSRQLDEETGREFELWEPERLRRLAAIFEEAVGAELETNRLSRTRIHELNVGVGVLREALDRAEEEIDRLREEAGAAYGEARVAEAERDALRAQLDEVTGSRAWGAITRYRTLRGSLTDRAPRPGA